MPELTHIGLDVHKETIAVAVLRPGTSECEVGVIANTPAALHKLIARFPERAELCTCYEAGASAPGQEDHSDEYREGSGPLPRPQAFVQEEARAGGR